MRSLGLFIAILAVVVPLSGCGKPEAEVLGPVAKAPAGLEAEATEEMKQAALQLAEDVRSGRADAVAERFDLEAFVRGVCLGTGATGEVRRDFTAGFEQGLSQRPGGLLADYMSGEFRFLRLVEVDSSTQMLFRAWDEERGIDYLRCAADRAGGADWRIVDLYSFTSGESFTDSVRRTYLPVLAGGEKSEVLRSQYEPLEAVVEALERGDPRAARQALLAMPEEQRGERFARTLELQALSQIEDAADDYAAAVEAFEVAFPDDPSLPLRMLEAHSIRGEHAEALRRIDQLDQMLGGDPFLHFLRAGALSALERGDQALSGLKEAIAAEPEIEELRWALIQACLGEGDFETVAATLRALRSEFEYQLGVDDLSGAAEYAEFAKSAPGKVLLAELAESAGAGAGDCK